VLMKIPVRASAIFRSAVCSGGRNRAQRRAACKITKAQKIRRFGRAGSKVRSVVRHGHRGTRREQSLERNGTSDRGGRLILSFPVSQYWELHCGKAGVVSPQDVPDGSELPLSCGIGLKSDARKQRLLHPCLATSIYVAPGHVTSIRFAAPYFNLRADQECSPLCAIRRHTGDMLPDSLL